MTEQDLIKKVKKLEQIQPSQEWLDSTRHNLVVQIDFEQKADSKAEFGFFDWLKQAQSVALVTCLLLIFIAGPWLTIKASQPSLPGELLYSVKKATEDIQATVTSKESKAQLQVEFAGRRLEELAKITGDSFTSEEKDEKLKEVFNELKHNLAGASVYATEISEENAIAVAEKTKKIKENLDKTKEEISLDTQDDLAEVEKVVEELNDQILAVLTKQSKESEEISTTTPDEEIMIFLKETDEGTITTTDEVINGVKQ